MDDYPQVIFMQFSLKKILIPLFVLSLLFVFLFLGINYFGNRLASLSSIITAWVIINPLEIDVFAPAEVEIDKVFKVTAKVINKGEEKIENARGEIHPSEGLIVIKKDPVQEIGVLPGKKEKKASWAMKGEEIGSHIIIVSVSGELRGELISAEGSREIEVKESLSPGRKPSFDFLQRFFDFFREWFSY